MRQAEFRLSPATGVAAIMAWRRVLQARIVQLRHRAGVEAAWRQPSRAPRQSPPAVTVTAAPFSGSAALHRPLGPPQPAQLRRQRPGAVLQVLQVAVAVERPPVDTAGPAAPVAGLRGARTGVVGLRPASAAAALVDPRAGRDGDLPGPARLPAPNEASPPLAWLPRPNQPTKPAGTTKLEPHRGSTVLFASRACRAWTGPAGDPKTTADASCTVAVSISRMSCAAKAGLARPTKQSSMIRLGPISCAGGTQRPVRRPGSNLSKRRAGLSRGPIGRARLLAGLLSVKVDLGDPGEALEQVERRRSPELGDEAGG
jgi:hypothetical protein